MTTSNFTGPITDTDPEVYKVKDRLVYKKLIDVAVARRFFPQSTWRPRLTNWQDTFFMNEILDDLKTNYGLKAVNMPVMNQVMRPQQFTVPKMYGALKWDKDQKAAIDAGTLSINERILRGVAKIGEDEDMYAIAGEATENGVVGVADETNFSTNATADLDLTTFLTARTTLKGMIAQMRAAMKTSKIGLRTPKLAPLLLLVTSDVEDRLTEMSSADTTTDTSTTDGLDLVNSILTKYGAAGSRVEVSDMLGATVSRRGNSFQVTTDGNTNALLASQHELHYGVAVSKLRQTPVLHPNGDLEHELDERIVPYSVVQGALINSAAVDIVA